jgi:hypothetical protein
MKTEISGIAEVAHKTPANAGDLSLFAPLAPFAPLSTFAGSISQAPMQAHASCCGSSGSAVLFWGDLGRQYIT